MHFIVPKPSIAFPNPLKQHPEENLDPRGSLRTEAPAPFEMTRSCSLRAQPAFGTGSEKLYGMCLQGGPSGPGPARALHKEKELGLRVRVP